MTPMDYLYYFYYFGFCVTAVIHDTKQTPVKNLLKHCVLVTVYYFINNGALAQSLGLPLFFLIVKSRRPL